MLKALRHKKTAKKVWIILAAIIVPAFVLWGSGSLIRSKQESNYAGMIFGKKVSLLEYKDALDAVKNSAVMQFGDKFSEMRQFLNLERQAWERVILLYEAKKRKIKASDREVISLIQAYPFFQRNGRFDNRIYNELLQYVFHTQARIFEEETRQNIIIWSKLFSQVTRGVKVDEDEIKREYAKANQEVSLYYIASLSADFSKDINPSEQEVQDYFNQNSLEFKQPLSFNLGYVSSESQDKIKEVYSRLNKKDDLAKLAKESDLELKQTGLFTQADPVPGIGWSPEILNLVTKLKVGEFSAPIHIDKN
jgi:peptidyl-prolyl cis-trans isomerase D